MRIIQSTSFIKKAQVGPAFELEMENEIERQEDARKKMRTMLDEPKPTGRRPKPRSVFDDRPLNEIAKDTAENKERVLDDKWKVFLDRIKQTSGQFGI